VALVIDMQTCKFAPLDSTAIYPKPGHKLLYTPMTSEMKCPTNIPLSCAFYFISFIVDATHAPTISQMIRSTSYHRMTLLVHRSWPHLLFTIASIHRRQILLKLPRYAVYRFKASNLPFTLATGPSSQASSWSSPPSNMTQCHVSYAISSFITCVSFSTSPSHFHLYGMCCSHKCTCGLISCVSHINIY
jgi:hypothetical protein